WDSWLAPQTTAIYGFDFFLAAGVWLALWCLLLLWAFTRRLRRGLNAEVAAMAQRCALPATTAGLFSAVERECLAARRFRQELSRLDANVASLRSLIELRQP